MQLDHFTTQFLTGHGDFRTKLHSFNLVTDPMCECYRKPETVNHVLRFCPRTKSARIKLKRSLRDEGVAWPPEDGVFLTSKKTYRALATFAREALTDCSDRYNKIQQATTIIKRRTQDLMGQDAATVHDGWPSTRVVSNEYVRRKWQNW